MGGGVGGWVGGGQSGGRKIVNIMGLDAVVVNEVEGRGVEKVGMGWEEEAFILRSRSLL
jgi:hypothetical protein